KGRGGVLGQAASTTDGQRSSAGHGRADAEAPAGNDARADGQSRAVPRESGRRAGDNSSRTEIPVVLSTGSVFPERTTDAFELAAGLGYDGVEVMVTADPVSQDADVLRRLADYHGVGVKAVHAPCLLITQRVWGREPWAKLVKAADVAERLGASVVVVH